jgi:hypothetical protein
MIIYEYIDKMFIPLPVQWLMAILYLALQHVSLLGSVTEGQFGFRNVVCTTDLRKQLIFRDAN